VLSSACTWVGCACQHSAAMTNLPHSGLSLLNSDSKGCVVIQGAAAEDDLEEEEIEFSDDEKVSLKLNLLSCMLFIDGP
jgi:hypothetical protein